MNESIYFFTLHKCASTLFSDFILKNLQGLRHIDYASCLYGGKRVEVKFKPKGEVYGPIRLSAHPQSPVYQQLVAPASKEEFIKDKIAIFFVRDPRDVLVSSYYSFGYTHGLSSVKEIRDQQVVRRAKVQQETLDHYVLKAAAVTAQNFETLYALSLICKRGLLLKYEDMIYRFDHFVQQFSQVVDLEEPVIQEIFARTRPKYQEDTSTHRRSGQPGEFSHKLAPETLRALNAKLDHVLEVLQYEK